MGKWEKWENWDYSGLQFFDDFCEYVAEKCVIFSSAGLEFGLEGWSSAGVHDGFDSLFVSSLKASLASKLRRREIIGFIARITVKVCNIISLREVSKRALALVKLNTYLPM